MYGRLCMAGRYLFKIRKPRYIISTEIYELHMYLSKWFYSVFTQRFYYSACVCHKLSSIEINVFLLPMFIAVYIIRYIIVHRFDALITRTPVTHCAYTHDSMSGLFINWFYMHTSKRQAHMIARLICTFKRCERSSSQISSCNPCLEFFITQMLYNDATCKFVIRFALASQASRVCFSQVTDYKQIK